MRITNMKIGLRLSFAFGLMVSLLLVMAVFGVLRLNSLGAQMRDVVEDKYPKTVLSNEIIKNVNAIARSSRNILLMTKQGEITEQLQAIEKADKKIQAQISKLDILIVSPTGRAIFNKILDGRTQFSLLENKVLDLLRAGEREQATEVLLNQVRPVQLSYMTQLEALITYQNQLMLDAGKKVEQQSQAALLWIGIISLVAILFAVVTALMVTRSIVRPLALAVEIAETVARGDLTMRFDTSAGDETGRLFRALKTMTEQLLFIVSQVRRGTDSIAHASHEIALGNMDLSHRTEGQASALEQTASAMHELAGTVSVNTHESEKAQLLACFSIEAADQGARAVENVVATMATIDASSKRIEEIIGVIDSIAFQTNILALNAAVEAARAGEHGHGFAIVATEVRALALRSRSAAQEIKLLVADSVQQVNSGSQLVAQAGASVKGLVNCVEEVAAIITKITAANLTQSVGITQINQAIAHMDDSTQQNAALVEQATAAAQELRDQAANLLQTVHLFKLEGSSSHNKRERMLS